MDVAGPQGRGPVTDPPAARHAAGGTADLRRDLRANRSVAGCERPVGYDGFAPSEQQEEEASAVRSRRFRHSKPWRGVGLGLEPAHRLMTDQRREDQAAGCAGARRCAEIDRGQRGQQRGREGVPG